MSELTVSVCVCVCSGGLFQLSDNDSLALLAWLSSIKHIRYITSVAGPMEHSVLDYCASAIN